jgi:ribosomal protein S18 acetylase RimI-like enzyme
MDNFEIRTYRNSDEAHVINLWKKCKLVVPWNDPKKDIQRKLSENPELFFVGLLENLLIVSCMAGFDGHRGWVYYVAVHHDWQQKGFASKIMEHAEKILKEIGCPKIQLMVRRSNLGVIEFYKKIGYKIDPLVTMGKTLIDDKKFE